MPITIRDATVSDSESIVAFNYRLAVETERKELDREVLRAGVKAAMSNPGLCRYFIAQRGANVVGQTMITYEFSDWRAGVLWWIQSVYVDPTCRRSGVFRKLFEHIQSMARQTEGVIGIRLYVEQGNKLAMRAYKALGMTASGHIVYEVDWSGAVKTID